MLHEWCNKGHGICYPVCGMMHIKEPLLLIRKSSPCGGRGLPLLLSEWSFAICLMPYNSKYNVLSASLNNRFPFLSFHNKRRKEMFYLMMHSTHFIYCYMASDIWLRTILIVRKETCCCHIGYSFRLGARVILYAPSHRHTMAFGTPVVEHWLEWEIAQ